MAIVESPCGSCANHWYQRTAYASRSRRTSVGRLSARKPYSDGWIDARDGRALMPYRPHRLPFEYPPAPREPAPNAANPSDWPLASNAGTARPRT